jgi:hypothetical protein
VATRPRGSPQATPRAARRSRPRTAIRALYTDLLGRADGGDADTVGQAYWLSRYSASVIAAQFLFSPERRGYLVNTLDNQILNRNAEPQGLALLDGPPPQRRQR